MSFTTLRSTQLVFLEKYLRGTNRSLTSAQAEATFGIHNLRARVSELRTIGLAVRKTVNTRGNTAYSVSRRDVYGNQFKLFS